METLNKNTETKKLSKDQVVYMGWEYNCRMDLCGQRMVLIGKNDKYDFSIEEFTNKVINGSIQVRC